jgi:KUP system potassium uptake protein
MVLTTVVVYFVARERFGWKPGVVVALCAVFLAVDLAFFGATLFKIPDGGWFPLVVAAIVFTVLSTWRTGRRLVNERLTRGGLALKTFISSLAETPPLRAPGAGAYLYATPGVTPPALRAALRFSDSLHEQVLIVSVVTEAVPRVHAVKRARVTDLGHGFHQIVLHFGFMEDPDVPRALADRVVNKLGLHLDTVTYFVGRESLRVTDRPGMVRWREHLYAVLLRNTTSAARYFNLPLEQTAELGVPVEL